MKTFGRYVIGTILFVLIAPVLVQIVLTMVGPLIPHASWLEPSILAALYVATLVWLHRRGGERHPPPPYVVFSLVYWTLFGWIGIVVAMTAAHMEGGNRNIPLALTVAFAIAALPYMLILRRLRRRAEAGDGSSKHVAPPSDAESGET